MANKKKIEEMQAKAKIRLTKRLVGMGTKFRKDITVPVYGGVEVTIRPLSGGELDTISERTGYTIDEITGGGLDLDKLTEDEIQEIKDSGNIPPALLKKMDLKDISLTPKMTRFLGELCKFGIAPKTDEEDVREMVDDIIGFGKMMIGIEIMSLLDVKYQELEDFFALQKASSSESSTPPDTVSPTESMI